MPDPSLVSPERGHRHPSAFHAPESIGDAISELITNLSGSWKTVLPFLLIELVLYPIVNHFYLHFDRQLTLDTYTISVIAIFLSQMILMSQRRDSYLDRIEATNAYQHVDEINTKQDRQFAVLEDQTQTGNEQHQEILRYLAMISTQQDRIERRLSRGRHDG